MVEAAIILPFIAVLALGICEAGFFFRHYLVVNSMARTGARTAIVARPSGIVDTEEIAAWHDQRDYRIVRSVKNARSHIEEGDLIWIMVYKADDPDAKPPAVCLARLDPATAGPLTGQGVGGKCNLYEADDFAMSSAAWSGNPDKNDWPSSSRNVSHANGDYVGILAVTWKGSITGLFPKSIVMDRTVMKMEPQGGNAVDPGVVYWCGEYDCTDDDDDIDDDTTATTTPSEDDGSAY